MGKKGLEVRGNSNIRSMMDETNRQLGYTDVVPAGMGEPTARAQKKGAGIMGEINLNEEKAVRDLVAFGVNQETLEAFQVRALGPIGSVNPLFTGTEQGADKKADHTFAFELAQKESAVGRAGAVIMDMPADRGRLQKTQVADFHSLTDDADAPDAGIEFGQYGEWDFLDDESVFTYGCTIKTTRRLEKMVGKSVLESLLMQAVTLGAVKLVDQIAFDALAGKTTAATAPTVPELVAAGVDLNKARAIIGAGAHSGAQFVDGRPFFNGVAAIGSKMVTGAAYVGDFSKLVMMMKPQLQIITKRLDAHGGFEMNVFADVKPFILDEGQFFNVAAEV